MIPWFIASRRRQRICLSSMEQEYSSEAKLLYPALVRFFRSHGYTDPEAEAGRCVRMLAGESAAEGGAPEEVWRVMLDAARNGQGPTVPRHGGSAANAAPVSFAHRFRQLSPEDREFLFYYLRAFKFPAEVNEVTDPRGRFLKLLRTIFVPPEPE